MTIFNKKSTLIIATMALKLASWNKNGVCAHKQHQQLRERELRVFGNEGGIRGMFGNLFGGRFGNNDDTNSDNVNGQTPEGPSGQSPPQGEFGGINGGGNQQPFGGVLNGSPNGPPSGQGEEGGPDVEGNHNRGPPRDGPVGRIPPGIKFNNDTCAVDGAAIPACIVGPPQLELEGAWVCRTVYDIVTGEQDTFSACVDTEHFIDTDVCGCCGGVCPSQEDLACGCACNLEQQHAPGAVGDNNVAVSTEGVWITMDDAAGGADGDNIRCVPSDMAYQQMTGPGLLGRPTCVEMCP